MIIQAMNLVGMFRFVAGTIQNLYLENVDIISGGFSIGPVCGRVDGKITRVGVSGSIQLLKIRGDGTGAGGIVGTGYRRLGYRKLF